jgi:hypothetical protein
VLVVIGVAVLAGGITVTALAYRQADSFSAGNPPPPSPVATAAQPVKEIIVWLEPTDVPAQIVELRSELSKVHTVHGCVFHSKLTDYREAKHLLSKNEYSMLTLSATPASIRCVAATSALSGIVTRFSGQPGVEQVEVPPHPNRLPIRSGA